MAIARKSLIVKEAIGWFVAGLVADFAIIILTTTLVFIFNLEWATIVGAVVCLIVPFAMSYYGAQKEARRQVTQGVRPNPGILVHPFFGEIEPECDGEAGDMWHGEIAFKPVVEKIGVTIIASYDGPSESQVEFANWVKTNFSSLIIAIEPKLRERLSHWKKLKLEGEILDEFTLVHLEIPSNGDSKNDWSISFESKSDIEHVFEVGFEDGKPSYVQIDG